MPQMYFAADQVGALPLVTVVTVVRNDQHGLARTLASVAAQDYDNLEYIVVDGNSTDGTVKVIRENEVLIDYWLSEKDSGLYDAMNKGKAAAKGHFVVFANAGDVFSSRDSISRIFSGVRDFNVLLFGNVCLQCGSTKWKVPARLSDGRLRSGYLPHHQTIFYPRAFFANENYDLRFQVMGDVDYTSRALRLFPGKYVDVDIINSTLGGFTFKVCGSLRGTSQMVDERRELQRRYYPGNSKFRVWLSCCVLYMKFIAIKIGGVKGATLVMKWKHKLMASEF
jgi:glycosyltransferase involved in cell wall biosynthesis